MKIQQVLDSLDKKAPFSGAEAWDNGGLLVGSPSDEVRGILVTLDVTAHIVEVAVQAGVNLIVAHHPVIFHPLSAVDSGSAVYRAAAAGVGIIGFHTCYDNAPGGVSKLLAEKIELLNIAPVAGAPCVMLGDCDFPSAVHFARFIRDTLGAPCVTLGALSVRYTEKIGEIRRAAVCPGAGGDFLETAAAAGADAFLTGECKYHEYLRAYELGISLVTAGHYETEVLAIPPLAAYLKNSFPEIPITAFTGKPPIVTL